MIKHSRQHSTVVVGIIPHDAGYRPAGCVFLGHSVNIETESEVAHPVGVCGVACKRDAVVANTVLEGIGAITWSC